MTTPLAEYLATSYRPDCDYLDGDIVERNVGERDHSKAQVRLCSYLFHRADGFGIHVFPGQRVQVGATRYRVPDVCVVVGPEPDEQIFRKPPFLCAEVLSPRDTMTSMQERINDYLQFGVEFVWLIDPRLRRAYVCTRDGMKEAVLTLSTVGPDLNVPLSEIF